MCVVQTICFNISIGTLVEKDYVGHIAAGRKLGCILDLACQGRAFGFRKRRGNLFYIYENIIFRKYACHTLS